MVKNNLKSKTKPKKKNLVNILSPPNIIKVSREKIRNSSLRSWKIAVNHTKRVFLKVEARNLRLNPKNRHISLNLKINMVLILTTRKPYIKQPA